MLKYQKLKIDYIPVHWQTQYKGQVLDWLPCDTLQKFQKNILNKDTKQYFEEQNWSEPGAFKYSINLQGFRTSEIEQNTNSIVALGCSHTCGIGLPESDVWVSRLEKMSGLNCINLGVAGASLDTIFRISNYWLKIIKPKIAILLCPPIHRFELRRDINDMTSFLPGIDLSSEDSLICNRWWQNEENSRFNAYKNVLAIEKLCNKLDIKCFAYATQELRTIDLARDMLHHGPKAHLAFAQKVFADITSNING